jgi:hypothetical protein
MRRSHSSGHPCVDRTPLQFRDVVEVGFVHDLRDAPQHRVGQVVAAQDRLKAPVHRPVAADVVGQVDPAHVERGRIGRSPGPVGAEHELSLRR